MDAALISQEKIVAILASDEEKQLKSQQPAEICGYKILRTYGTESLIENISGMISVYLTIN